jgi:hypothetical protein
MCECVHDCTVLVCMRLYTYACTVVACACHADVPFFYGMPCGALYWFANMVTSFIRISKMKLGGSSTQIQESLEEIAFLASTCATWFDSRSQCSIEMDWNSYQRWLHSSYIGDPAVAEKPPCCIVSTTSKQSDWIIIPLHRMCCAKSKPSFTANTSADGASTTCSK